MSEPAAEEPAEEAAPEAVEEPVETDEPAEVEVEEAAAPAEIDGDALIREKAAGQHDLGRIYGADFTREEWEETLDRMTAYGAEIHKGEKKIIIDYLLSLKD